MPTYDPQRNRARRQISDEEPAPVDALLGPTPDEVVSVEPVVVEAVAAEPSPRESPVGPVVVPAARRSLPAPVVAAFVVALLLAVLVLWRRRLGRER